MRGYERGFIDRLLPWDKIKWFGGVGEYAKWWLFLCEVLCSLVRVEAKREGREGGDSANREYKDREPNHLQKK